MKQCSKCGRIYTDDDTNFCLDDGELLAYFSDGTGRRAGGYADDSPPTVVLDPTRVTNQPWNDAGFPAAWHGQAPAAPVPAFGMASYIESRDQTLPTISLVLGIISCFMVCCAGGIWLGLPAAIVGYIGMRNADRDPQHYGGRGMAIAGLVIGTITLLASVFFFIFSRLG